MIYPHFWKDEEEKGDLHSLTSVDPSHMFLLRIGPGSWPNVDMRAHMRCNIVYTATSPISASIDYFMFYILCFIFYHFKSHSLLYHSPSLDKDGGNVEQRILVWFLQDADAAQRSKEEGGFCWNIPLHAATEISEQRACRHSNVAPLCRSLSMVLRKAEGEGCGSCELDKGHQRSSLYF